MRIRPALVVLISLLAVWPASAGAREKLDATLAERAASSQRGQSRVIITATDPAEAVRAVRDLGGSEGRRLDGGQSQVAVVPNAALRALAEHPAITSIRLDRAVSGATVRTTATVGAAWVREELGLDGTGVGVAVIDSGVADWHDDLSSSRIAHFVDFVDDLPLPSDDYGHGTHVAGTIAGNGFDSGGLRRGVAPGAQLVVLRVLDASGDGHISNVIAAIDHIIQNRFRYNIRVINLSVSAGVYESYLTDPLTLAAKRAVDAGIVVVTAAGNLGRNSRGRTQYGGVTSPGNAPWVITVGAADDQGTVSRADDVVAGFSSRGPTHIDRTMKPDVVAPGVGVESLAAPGSTLYDLHQDALINGTVDTAYPPYISLTGTSMAAPIVSGTIALMLQANPKLTPNLVKAILQYTADRRPRIDITAQGAGMLNARGAVQLAIALGGGEPGPTDPSRWARHIIWSNTRSAGGTLSVDATAWQPGVTWGASATPDGREISWGRMADNSVWALPATTADTSNPSDANDDLWSDLQSPNLASAASLTSRTVPQHGSLPAAFERPWLWLWGVR